MKNPLRKTIYRYLTCPGSGTPKVGGARGTCADCGRSSIPLVDGVRMKVAAEHKDMRRQKPVRVWRWQS